MALAILPPHLPVVMSPVAVELQCSSALVPVQLLLLVFLCCCRCICATITVLLSRSCVGPCRRFHVLPASTDMKTHHNIWICNTSLQFPLNSSWTFQETVVGLR